jgi:hypothetical protein
MHPQEKGRIEKSNIKIIPLSNLHQIMICHLYLQYLSVYYQLLSVYTLPHSHKFQPNIQIFSHYHQKSLIT